MTDVQPIDYFMAFRNFLIEIEKTTPTPDQFEKGLNYLRLTWGYSSEFEVMACGDPDIIEAYNNNKLEILDLINRRK